MESNEIYQINQVAGSVNTSIYHTDKTGIEVIPIAGG